ncbi:hypothetical protein PPSIR1_16150 [Plesiocystis pacifica SIR-1]|uniref:Uncharacterized protein n=1 Tax=Plesiocystis pacifica SIR-1 TaxID=391625 RepID=A6GJ50_9BACT|nr:hypothetical protein [Plesiocystis pacifica]EDM74088.1 hypothetical protein PPSIR1_16150 [Plesiocystis pacifica SIR-1]
MSQIRVVEFNALPKATRERFVASASGQAEPGPVFEDTNSPGWGAVGWFIVLAMGAGTLYGVSTASFGEGVDGPGFIALYAIGAVLVLGGFLAMIRSIVTAKNMPYKLGTYLFPVDIVTAEDDVLSIQPLSEVSHVNVIHNHENGAYQNSTLRLVFSSGLQQELTIFGQTEAQNVAHQMHQWRVRAAQIVESGDYGQFAALDPFFEARAGDWDMICATKNAKVSDGGPAAKASPALLQKAWLIGLIVGALLGGGSWYLRNTMSDDAMFEAVKDTNDTYLLNDYVYAGCTRHLDEVQNVLIPKAEFEEAKAEGSVTALRQFIETHPGSVHEPDARAAIHELFAKALADFQATASDANPNILTTVTAMLNWLEAADSPPVAVRFRAPDPSILHDVDEVVKSMTLEETGGLPIAAISPSFDDQRTRVRESYIVNELEAGFLRVIPADILDLELGERIPEDLDLEANRPDAPTIAVAYTVDASGSIYANELNTQGYVGIEIYFIVSMLIPGTDGAEPPPTLTFVLDVEPPSEFSVSTDGIALTPSDFLVYDVMAKKAFENLSTSLKGAFFSTGDASSLQIVTGEIPELPALDLAEGEEAGEED